MCPVIVIFAPTASGKTALARSIFGKSSLSVFKDRGEVISADSQAVYRGMDIGTAKPDEEEQKDIPHHLIDVVDPDQQFGVGEYMSMADSLCSQIWSRGRFPVVLGGTGFYIRNFLLGLPVTPESDEKTRQMVRQKLEAEGNKALYYQLKQIDPESAAKININDCYRICRALEVYYASGRPLSSFRLPQTLRQQYDFCTIILERDRKQLYERIDARVEQMFENGLPQEVERLKSMGYGPDSPGMKAIGYSEFFIPGLSLEQIKEKIKNDSHRYAKKQYVFMKDIPGARIFPAEDYDGILSHMTSFGEKYSLRQDQ